MGQGRTLLRKIEPASVATALARAKPHEHSGNRKRRERIERAIIEQVERERRHGEAQAPRGA